METVATASVRKPGAGTFSRPLPGSRPRTGKGDLRRRAERLPAAALTATTLFLAARLTATAVVTLTAWRLNRDPVRILGRSWDSIWYLHIAAHGYGRTVPYSDGTVHSDLAFFPLYPWAIRGVTSVTQLSGEVAGLLVAWVAALAAAWGIYRVGERLHGRAVGTVLVLVWALLPHSVVLSMAYTEPVLTAFAAWALYAVLSRRWVWAGVLAALAGVSRPNGFAVAVAVVAAAVYEVWQERGKVPHRLWTGILLAPLGWCGYVAWVGLRKGDLLGGYFAVQRAWGSRFDFGVGAVDYVRGLVLRGSGRFVFPLALLTVLAAVVLFVLLLVDREPLPVVVYAGVLLVIVVGGSGFFDSKPRFLLPAFPLLLPLARALVRTARARPWHAAVVVGALAGLSFVYGTYLVTFARAPL
ncbi:glycosyltransferase family 39 protein [Streptomyces sp. NPDC002004]